MSHGFGSGLEPPIPIIICYTRQVVHPHMGVAQLVELPFVRARSRVRSSVRALPKTVVFLFIYSNRRAGQFLAVFDRESLVSTVHKHSGPSSL